MPTQNSPITKEVQEKLDQVALSRLKTRGSQIMVTMHSETVTRLGVCAKDLMPYGKGSVGYLLDYIVQKGLEELGY